jgi:hypothetical protein
MKKLLMLPALLLALAGMVLTGCPSDPEEGKKIDNPDLTLTNGGKYQYVFTSPNITDGVEYEVIFNITEVDDGLVGGHFGGQLYYEKGGEQKLLSGWSNGSPDTIVEGTKTYRWTFKAGAKNNDGNDTVSPATTPGDADKQYFQVMAQTSNWKEFASDLSFGIKGSITVQPKAQVTLKKDRDIVTTGGSAADTTTGKGNIEGEYFASVNAAAAGSVLKFSIIANVGASGSGSNEPGWGVGAVGNKSSDNAAIIIPVGTFSGDDVSFTSEVLVSDALACRDNTTDNWLFVNIWGGKITKCELWVPE